MVTRIITLIVIAPLIVSVVVRGYGWQLVLQNGPKGMLNWILMTLHVVDAPISVLTEVAVVIGSLHVFFPKMVLPLASALGKIDPNLEDAARLLGAPWWKVFLRVTLPLSMPGFIAGFTLVFSLTAGSFVIPAILGGASAVMLGNLIEQQIFVVYDWPFAAAIAVVPRRPGPCGERRLDVASGRPASQEGRVMDERFSGFGAFILYTITAGMMLFILSPLLLVMAVSVSDSVSQSKEAAQPLKMIEEPMVLQPIDVGMKKKDPALLAKINQILLAMDQAGEINQLWDKWLCPSTEFKMTRTDKVAPSASSRRSHDF
ncbi:ABC transporter permease subunit [Bradyrhizobium yuanmingense]|uniref:ABC transporter permease subunit n=1 Tax=Bradyrhizobium yuanmingense TaxID=108015 RepID=UPI0021A5F3FB|nr:ABC transporter permease subunit [Bradyrhizobium sp. CB1024]UWU82872.1 ABC transporter permease subunit [Bradyrhizobium sp. CB1024]